MYVDMYICIYICAYTYLAYKFYVHVFTSNGSPGTQGEWSEDRSQTENAASGRLAATTPCPQREEPMVQAPLPGKTAIIAAFSDHGHNDRLAITVRRILLLMGTVSTTIRIVMTKASSSRDAVILNTRKLPNTTPKLVRALVCQNCNGGIQRQAWRYGSWPIQFLKIPHMGEVETGPVS